MDYSWGPSGPCVDGSRSLQRFGESRMQTREAWSQIDVQLKRRNDLIPNLIETVKAMPSTKEIHLQK